MSCDPHTRTVGSHLLVFLLARFFVFSLGPPPPLLRGNRERWLRTELGPGSAMWAIVVPGEVTAAVLRPVLSWEGVRAGLPPSPTSTALLPHLAPSTKRSDKPLPPLDIPSGKSPSPNLPSVITAQTSSGG